MQDVLSFMKEQFNILAIPYEFMEWSKGIKYPYFIGEIAENEPLTEEGLKEYTFTLTGTHRGKFSTLEEIRAKIEKHFDHINGLRAATDKGVIAVFYSNALFVPTGEADLKRVQIYLKIKYWKGAI